MEFDLNAIMASLEKPSKTSKTTPTEPTVTVTTESDDIVPPKDGTVIVTEEDSGRSTYDPMCWGGGKHTMGPDGKSEANKGIHVYLTNGEVYIYIVGFEPKIGNLYPFMSQIEPGTKVHVFLYHPSALEYTEYLQVCLMDCPGETHTYLGMVDPFPGNTNLVCIYAYGDVLEPVPYGIVALTEPFTMYHGMGFSTDSTKHYGAVVQSVLQQWYDQLETRGILLSGEREELNKGNSIVIKDFNTRIR